VLEVRQDEALGLSLAKPKTDMLDTEGRKLLAAYLTQKGRTQTWLAGILGVQQSTVSHWLRGAWRPPPELRKALERVAGIAVDAWLTAEEVRRFETAVDTYMAEAA